MSIIEYIFGNEDKKVIKKLEKTTSSILNMEDELKALTDEELKNKSLALRDKIRSHINREDREMELNNNIVLAFALVREASRRTLKMMHYKVQITGGLVIHNGNLAEMRTGEGKTLVATSPAFANALLGYGVHIVTVNDYLSKRDAVWMGQVYNLLGMSVGVLNHEKSYLYNNNPTKDKSENKSLDNERDAKGEYKVEFEFLSECSRREAYRADITYGTNHEYGFDYLRDNLAYDTQQLSQRSDAEGGHYFAIVDEADSILIDEARTPLIISNASHDSEAVYKTFADLANKMIINTHYTVDEKQRAIQLTNEGITFAERYLKVPTLYDSENVKLIHHLETAVRAKALFIREKEYVIKDREIIIVDEFTGRMQPGRRWSDGLHQAVEAKENVLIQKESRTVASITYQNYFRFYHKLSGMTGTAKTNEEELLKVYKLPVIAIPTHNPSQRKDHKDIILQSKKGKMKALAKRVKEIHSTGQPILIGTISIDNNEVVSQYIEREGIKHNVLNAKNHEREGEIIANAGKRNAVTIATNLAGRGVDIKLGGAEATQAEHDEIADLGGLFVIGTERHEARRIDNQLRGRSGRLGDRGETQFYVSLEDDLMRIFGSDKLKAMMGKFGLPEDEPIESSFVSKAIESSQEKIEGYHFDSRKHTLQYDDVLNKQRSSVYDKRKKILFNDTIYMDQYINELSSRSTEVANLFSSKKEKYGQDFYVIFRQALLQMYDVVWMDHLEYMDHLRENVNLRAYGQRDPIVEYKKEALHMFRHLDDKIATDIIGFVTHMDNIFMQMRANEMHNKKSEIGEVGRNDPCPCGSGKKLKKCDCQEYAFMR